MIVAADTVEFVHPPVREAVIGLEFDPLPLTIVDLARLCDRWSGNFPIVAERAALEPSAAIGPGGGGAEFQIGSGMPPIRLWLLEPSSHYLVQVQRDRLLLNWRKVGSESEYPRYVALREKFLALLADFGSFLAEVRQGLSISVSVAEFTYINSIIAHDRADGVFSVFREPSTPLPGEPYILRFQEVRNLTHQDTGSPGQLSVSSEPVMSQDGISETQLTITTKFFPTAVADDVQAASVLDEARRVSRAAFVSFTTPEMHESWGVASE